MRFAGWAPIAPLIVAAGCAREPAAASAALWEVPELPGPVRVEVDGREVDPVLVHGYLLPLWTEHWSAQAQAGAAPSAESFFRDPRALFSPLARGIALLHEAEARWPELPEEDVARLRAEMAAGAGGALEALARRVGEAGVRAHVERELRKRLILADFAAECEPVGEDEVYARYDEMLAEAGDPGDVLAAGLDFAALAPEIRADLERSRAIARQEAWLDARMPSVRVSVTLPGLPGASW